jgi:hypothetical protein
MINFDFEFFTEDGQKVILNSANNKRPLVMKEAAVKALLYPMKDTKTDHAEKIMRYDTAVVINNFGSNAILNQEQKDLVLKAMGELFIPVVVGQAKEILEGKTPYVFKDMNA